MSYRTANRSDFATGLTTQTTLYDYWGDVALSANTKITSNSQEESLLHKNLWIWVGHDNPTQPPMDEEKPFSYRLTLELLIETVRRFFIEDKKLPANFLGVIWRTAEELDLINHECPVHPLALLSFGSHPSSALRNSISTSILTNRICKKLKYPTQKRLSITAAALTMNWTIFDIQDQLSSAKNTPNSTDMKLITEHPKNASNLLRNLGLSNEEWLNSIEQHHEEPDGKGYPAKLLANETFMGAKIIRTCDRYIALTSSRRYRTGVLTQEASKIARDISAHCPELLSALTDDLSDAPPGGIWINKQSNNLFLALGLFPEKSNFLQLSSDTLIKPKIEDMVEIPFPEFHNLQYTFGLTLLDKLAKRP